ncbi:MAG: DUF308 domain-containing protein [Microbacteriaceae bacterium]
MIPSLNLTPTQLATQSGFSLQLHRGETFVIAVVGIVLGVMALIWQGATLSFVGVVFGAYLIVSGVVRIAAAFVSRHIGVWHRLLIGLLGVIIVAAGILCIADPLQSIVLLAFVIGVGWIAAGIIDLVGAVTGAIVPRWLGLISGAFSLIAGLVAWTLPTLTIQAFIVVGAILLIAVSLMSLLTLPRRGARAPW